MDDASSISRREPGFRPGRITPENEPGRQLDSIGWAIFFIWVGTAMLTGLSWGWFLLGAGILVLAVQGGRFQLGLEVEKFWVACGLVLLAGAAWQLLHLAWPLTPLLLIFLGLILLGRSISRAI